MFKAKTTIIMRSGRVVRLRGGYQQKSDCLVASHGDGFRLRIWRDAIAGTIVRYWWQRWPRVE